jgi:hypothetical protein
VPLVCVIDDIIVEAGYRVWTEVTGLYGPFPADMPAEACGRTKRGEKRRVDLAGTKADLTAKAVDPTLRDTAASSTRTPPAEVIAGAEAERDAHYVGTPPALPLSLRAFACLETNLGPSATVLLRTLSAGTAQRQNGGQEPSDQCSKRSGARGPVWVAPYGSARLAS